MAKIFNLSIVSPEGSVLAKDVEFVVLPGEEGELGILANHAPMIATLKPGVLRYNVGTDRAKVAVGGGFAEVSDNRVSVLADSAEPGELIDVKRARAAKERAEKRLAQANKENIDVERAELALHRALARLSAADAQ